MMHDDIILVNQSLINSFFPIAVHQYLVFALVCGDQYVMSFPMIGSFYYWTNGQNAKM